MAVTAMATPKILSGPGWLFGAPVGTTLPTQVSNGTIFTDVIASPWLPFGPTSEGSEFSYSTSVEPINVAEFFDPIKYETTERSGSIAFALANYTLTNYRRALNGGVAALVPTGTAGQEITKLSPPKPGTEVRISILWESLDGSMRLHIPQCIQGGEVTSAFRKAPDLSLIPCTFNFEVPASGDPFDLYAAGTARVA